jgi:hypothetical protein
VPDERRFKAQPEIGKSWSLHSEILVLIQAEFPILSVAVYLEAAFFLPASLSC